jgi:fluoride exporter
VRYAHGVQIVLLMVFGALGTLARYGVAVATQTWLPRSAQGFPWATLTVNVIGSFVLALVVFLALGGRVSQDVRLAVGTGFCGAFTTFSTFALETDALLTRGAFLEVTLYVMGNLLLGFMAVLLGKALAAQFV